MILPWALPGVVEGIVWTGIWDANTGLLNSVLELPAPDQRLPGLPRAQPAADDLAIELVQVWQITPLSALLVLAALQNMPGRPGRGGPAGRLLPVGGVRRVTLPLVRPGIAIAMVQALIATLNVFDQPFILNGAADTGTSVTMQTYFISFQNLDFGERLRAVAVHHHRDAGDLARDREGRLPAGGVLMATRRPRLRTVGIVLMLAWTIVPMYWTLNSSLQTDAQLHLAPGALRAADAHPAELHGAALRRQRRGGCGSGARCSTSSWSARPPPW